MRSYVIAWALLITCLLWARALAGADEGAAPNGGERRAVTDPVYVTWDHACVVFRYTAQGKWERWASARAVLPEKVITAVGPHAAAALDPEEGYGGWLFDLHSHAWTKIPPSPIGRPPGIMDPIAVVFVGGQLVVWGAMGGDPQGAVLDTATMKWQPSAKAPVVPRYRCVTAVLGSKVMVWGGYGPLGPRRIGPQVDGAVYDVATDTWAKLPAPPVAGHRYGCAAVTTRGRFVIVGGLIDGKVASSGMAFDPAAGKWEIIPPAPVPVGAHPACAADDDRLFLWSGTGPEGSGTSRGGAVYDFWTRKWTTLPEAPIPPRLLAFTRIDAHGATVWGGWDSDPMTSRTDGARFDFDKRAWQALPPMPHDIPEELHPGW